jgi:hypothetical protein
MMNRLDVNRAALLVTVIILALFAVLSGYRLEIGIEGIKLERLAVAAQAPRQVKSQQSEPGAAVTDYKPQQKARTRRAFQNDLVAGAGFEPAAFRL